jgi:hypothetical protein
LVAIDPVPRLHRQAVEIAKGDREVVGGVIDENIEAAEGLAHLAGQPLHRRAVGDVTAEGAGVGLITRHQLAGDAVGLLAALRIHDGDMRALLGECVADALSRPAIAARHQCHRARRSIASIPAVEAGKVAGSTAGKAAITVHLIHPLQSSATNPSPAPSPQFRLGSRLLMATAIATR